MDVCEGGGRGVAGSIIILAKHKKWVQQQKINNCNILPLALLQTFCETCVHVFRVFVAFLFSCFAYDTACLCTFG